MCLEVVMAYSSSAGSGIVMLMVSIISRSRSRIQPHQNSFEGFPLIHCVLHVYKGSEVRPIALHKGKLYLFEAFLRRFPIDDIPNRAEIFRLAVLVLETGDVNVSMPQSSRGGKVSKTPIRKGSILLISMLPSIDA